MLTLFYAGATFAQSWRIKGVCRKIEKLADHASVVFYQSNNGYDAALASSELFNNRLDAKITDILWLNTDYRGCCLSPVQKVSISSWISFPKMPCLIPFSCNYTKKFDENVNSIYLLLETEIEKPHTKIEDEDFPKLENYGKPIAWRIDSKLAVLLATNVHAFTSLLLETFLKNKYRINDQMPLTRVASIKYDGAPRLFEDLLPNYKDCELKDFKSLCTFASQATEVDDSKSPSDHCSLQNKPDLIPIDVQDMTEQTTDFKPEDPPIQENNVENTEKNEGCTGLTLESCSQSAPESLLITPSTASNSTDSIRQTLNDVLVTSASKTPEKAVPPEQDRKPNKQQIKKTVPNAKPLNILIFSEISSVRESAIASLKGLLARDSYTIYPITLQQLEQKYWTDTTALVVVCGAVASNVAEKIVDYFLHGGKILSLCSDILNFILPTYRTAEVREHELVNFSYAKWKKVKMMHHIFCYQASPVKKNFSTDSEDSSKSGGMVCPRSLELRDLSGAQHEVVVNILGTEEIWNTPSLLVAKSLSGGVAVFSQIHLEMQPNQFENDEEIFTVLKQNNRIRLDILTDLLSKHLGVSVETTTTFENIYQNAFLLGRHEAKQELFESLKNKYNSNLMRTTNLGIQFCAKNDDEVPRASSNMLPILMNSCPEDFSTVEYFENLKTSYIGRLVIYAPIVNSTMNVINEVNLANGIAVLTRKQTAGVGRSRNEWISPEGCAMFSIQLHFELDTQLGRRLPLIQHLVAVALVNAIKNQNTYEMLNIGIKWPNDIYANGTQKIGGLVVKTTLTGTQALVNIGCGINLDNRRPTTCVNELILQTNKTEKTNLPLVSFEKYVAWAFNEIESVLERAQMENFDFFYKSYYELWLHNNQYVVLQNGNNSSSAEVIGIDDFGFLQVKLENGAIESVQPDGNSFDMLKGLIFPKQH